MRERSGRTKKPCPGCGKVVPYRKVSEVCNECRKDIREGQSHRKSELAGQRKKELVIVQFPEYEHWLPSLHHASPAYGDHKYESHVRTTFLELAKAASEPASGEHVGEQLVAGTDRRYGADANRTMPSVFAPSSPGAVHLPRDLQQERLRERADLGAAAVRPHGARADQPQRLRRVHEDEPERDHRQGCIQLSEADVAGSQQLKIILTTNPK